MTGRILVCRRIERDCALDPATGPAGGPAGTLTSIDVQYKDFKVERGNFRVASTIRRGDRGKQITASYNIVETQSFHSGQTYALDNRTLV
jgi:hypothetical protein